MSLEIFGTTIPILSAAHAAQWMGNIRFPRPREEYPDRAAADFLGEAGGHSCLGLCPVFNTNTTFWTKYLSASLVDEIACCDLDDNEFAAGHAWHLAAERHGQSRGRS